MLLIALSMIHDPEHDVFPVGMRVSPPTYAVETSPGGWCTLEGDRSLFNSIYQAAAK